MPTLELIESIVTALDELTIIQDGRKLVSASPQQVASTALKAHEEWLAEQGLVVVPREPTDAMTECSFLWLDGVESRRAWQDMISAALAEE